ncbi:alpha/beta hydrolase family protein [Streptomyces carpaticus]|uniref:alpha/beta hydrolase n=1 Tax=Streptomyces carpaticus TaxID=285558 RepID=UPI00220CF2AB|nr:alpha/beta hydrolase family protein [Streptomyces carpaticus]
MTVSRLRDLRTDTLTARAADWHTAVEWGEHGRAHVDRQLLAPLREKLVGETATAAETRLQLIADNCEYTRLQTGLVHAALLGLAEELAEAKARLRTALDEAAAHGYPVDDAGAVGYPETLAEDGSVRQEAGTATPAAGLLDRALDGLSLVFPGHRETAQQLANTIGAALQRATDTDTRYARTLRELICDRGIAVTDAMWRDAHADLTTAATSILGIADASAIPSGATPAENAAWWAALTDEEQAAYLSLHPAEIGTLDGLPTTTRDTANRAVLQVEEARLRQELDALLRAEPEKYAYSTSQKEGVSVRTVSDEWAEWNQRRELLAGQLTGIDAINERFAMTGENNLPEAYLLGFDTEGLGHAIIANGNPDTADHTAVYVPGTTSRLSESEGDIRRMTDLWRAAGVMGVDGVSTITWIGYDAPQSIVPEAAKRSFAEAGAPLFNSFATGLQVAQGGAEASHTTVIAHSYGSTVVGVASQQERLAVDDIIVAGSPGMTVNHAAELGIGEEHVWSLGSFSDPVPLLGAPAHGRWEFELYGEGLFGLPMGPHFRPIVPTMNEFGGNHMQSEALGVHSGYWDEGSVDLRNQAAVVVGRYDEVFLK